MGVYDDKWVRVSGLDGRVEMVSPKDILTANQYHWLAYADPRTEIGVFRVLVAMSLDPRIEGVSASVDGHGTRFMQIADGGKETSIKDLFPVSGTGLSEVFNDRLRTQHVGICKSCAYAALSALCSMTPGGGQGHILASNGGTPLYIVPKMPTLLDTIRLYGDFVGGTPSWWREGGPSPTHTSKEKPSMDVEFFVEAATTPARQVRLRWGSGGMCDYCGAELGTLARSMTRNNKAYSMSPGEYRDPMCIYSPKDGKVFRPRSRWLSLRMVSAAMAENEMSPAVSGFHEYRVFAMSNANSKVIDTERFIVTVAQATTAQGDSD